MHAGWLDEEPQHTQQGTPSLCLCLQPQLHCGRPLPPLPAPLTLRGSLAMRPWALITPIFFSAAWIWRAWAGEM